MNKEQILARLKQIWPTVYRIINGGLYYLFNLIRSIIRIAIAQLKGNNLG